MAPFILWKDWEGQSYHKPSMSMLKYDRWMLVNQATKCALNDITEGSELLPLLALNCIYFKPQMGMMQLKCTQMDEVNHVDGHFTG